MNNDEELVQCENSDYFVSVQYCEKIFNDKHLRFDRFDYLISFCQFFVLPTIIVVKNDRVLMTENTSIELGWLCFHCRWRWIK